MILSLLAVSLLSCFLDSTFANVSENEPALALDRRDDDSYVVMKLGMTPDKAEQTDFTKEEARPCQCGETSRLEARIVGGKPKTIEEYPFMAGLVALNSLFCGGAIINDRYILTAAHCFKMKVMLKHVRVRIGSTPRADNRHDLDVEEIVMHKFYNYTRSGHYDIALVKLRKPITFTPKIRPICLASTEEDYRDQVGIVAGWGLMEHNGQQSSRLLAIEMKIANIDRCIDLFSRLDRKVEYDINICAGGVLNQDACQGDSGGPLFQDRDGVFRSIGIVSWGLGCANENIPGIYTKIHPLLPWITRHIKVPLCSPAE